MFVRKGEDVDRLRLEQGLRAALANKADSDDLGDRRRAQAQINDIERRLRAM